MTIQTTRHARIHSVQATTLSPRANASQLVVKYPESDGEPVGETDFHISAIFYLRAALRYFFRNHPKLYVAANMLFYYEEGDPSLVKAPDIFVVKGIDNHERRTYKLWEEGVAPCVVFEITSRSTRLQDLGDKRALYEMLGVHEYFLFDPLGEYLTPRLQGWRLLGDSYQRMTLASDGVLFSEQLGLILRPDGNLLRVVDPATNETLPTAEEAVARALMAEAEVARLRVELARLRGD